VPVRVDRDERRALLAEAVWRIAARDGVRAASVRGVAREAGLSMGSVRHFFSTQDDLLRFAVAELVEQVRRRIEAGTATRLAAVAQGRPIEAAVALLEEVLPLDARRRTEARVWAAFTAPPVIDEQMADIRRSADDGIRQLCRSVLAVLTETGVLHPERDVNLESERMHALVDGLTIHLLVDPTEVSPGRVKSVLVVHLNDLRAAPGT
jgi:AcrR family transcriptional regulator